MKTLVGIAAAILIAIGLWSGIDRGGEPLTTASTAASSNLASLVSSTKADWQHGGIGGSVAVAEFGVRNNSDVPIRIDVVSCRFQKPGQPMEERTSRTYEIVQPRTQRTIRNLGFGFIDASLKSDCTITGAQKA